MKKPLPRMLWLLVLGLALLPLGACSDNFLYEPIVKNKPILDRSVQVNGNFCTDGSNDVVRPVKILIAMDTSLSMQVTDPDGTRAKALTKLLDSFPQDDPEVYVGVLLFAGFTPVYLTNNGQSGFQQLMQIDAAARANLADTLLQYAYPNGIPNRGATDFVKPLDEVYAAISRDISETNLVQLQNATPIRAQYSVIFLTDGAPSFDQDAEIYSRVTAIRSLNDQAGSVRFNTVHVFDPASPPSPICTPSADAGCPAQLIAQDIDRLQAMSDLGGGEFRDFENHEPINFLSFRLGATKRRYVIGRLTLFNVNAKPGSPVDEPDSDSDGLTDNEELKLGTDPTLVDTDGDGFSDGVEVYFKRLGAKLNPNGPAFADGGGQDPGCPPELRGVDTDGDGLLDCDEQFLGSNASAVDSDNDGLPDQLEWLGGTQVASNDALSDPDGDGLLNEAELRMHTNPIVADSTDLGAVAYRYTIVRQPTTETDGSTCYTFHVDNVLLVPTLDLGGGPGRNSLLLSISVVPEDDPLSPPIMHLAHLSAGYPTNGIKDPPDGVIPVKQADFARFIR